MNNSTMLDKLCYLEGTKGLIKSSLEERGVIVPSNTPFREYATFVRKLGVDELEEHVQGKLSIIRALNNKFGLEILQEATYSEIVEVIKSILVKNLQKSFNISTNINYNSFDMVAKVEMINNNANPISKALYITNKLNFADFNMKTN